MVLGVKFSFPLSLLDTFFGCPVVEMVDNRPKKLKEGNTNSI